MDALIEENQRLVKELEQIHVSSYLSLLILITAFRTRNGQCSAKTNSRCWQSVNNNSNNYFKRLDLVVQLEKQNSRSVSRMKWISKWSFTIWRLQIKWCSDQYLVFNVLVVIIFTLTFYIIFNLLAFIHRHLALNGRQLIYCSVFIIRFDQSYISIFYFVIRDYIGLIPRLFVVIFCRF